MYRHIAQLSLVAVVAVAALRGCDCSDTPLNPLEPWSCEAMEGRPGPGDIPCPDGQAFDKGVCAATRCDARGEPRIRQCCPGEICLGDGSCDVPISRLTLCENDAECAEGMRCMLRPLVYDPADCRNAASESSCNALNDPALECSWTGARCLPRAKTCGFEPVNSAGFCDNGGRVFNRRCIDGPQPPCAGGCALGSVCNIDTGRCEEPPVLANADHGCDQECGVAEILVYSDPDTMLWSQCCEVSCHCETVPPLQPGNWGRFSDVVVGPDALWVSGYDGTYGDLVLGAHGRLSGQLAELDYVDGVPSGGIVVADPAGPRGGQVEPGPNVGTYTAVALDGDLPRIAYYDLEAGNLKYASWSPGTREWVVGLVDDGRDIAGADAGDVGRYTSLVIDPDGIAHVTYYAHRVVAGGEWVTGPMYARALGADPLVYDDWEHLAIETVRSCAGACDASELCVLEGDTPTCAAGRDDCAGACACDQACADIAGTAACRRRLPLRLTEPCDGACPTGSTCVAGVPSGTVCLQTADDCPSPCGDDEVCVNDGTDDVCRRATPYSTIAGLPEGVGLFTSMALHDAKPTVVYYDRLLRQLRGAVADFDYDAPTLGSFTSGPVPVGCDLGSDNGHSASLAVAPDGDLLGVAYQGDGGDTLWLYTGVDLTGGTTERVDDGLRTGRADLVGASSSLAFGASADDPLIAYADQTENDLVLAYKSSGAWQRSPRLTDGAYGSFARIAVEGRTAWLTTYLRARDDRDRDISRLVVTIVDLDALP